LDTGDPEYEARVVTIDGLPSGTVHFTIAELRAFPQHDLDASFLRTTGRLEEYHMRGPHLHEIFASLGYDLLDFDGIGVVGTDGYYSLLSNAVVDATPDLMLALYVDGSPRLDDGLAPAWLAAQGQFGPFWVKMVERIAVYEELPLKNITSLWAFDAVTEGIERYMYEYYGSRDASVELGQIFTRFAHVDSQALFTMKSSDGFKRNEIMQMVRARYFIKYEGEDAPTNVSPAIRLGMNVHHIAWFSTNADAVIFIDEMLKYMDTAVVGGQTGIPISEALYEVEVEALRGRDWQIIGAGGERVTVPGEDLRSGILAPGPDGSVRVLWPPGSGYEDIDRLLRIRLAPDAAQTQDSASRYTEPGADTVLTITGDGVERTLYFSLSDLMGMADAYVEEVYSTLNNWPTRGFAVAKGADVNALLALAGLRADAKSITVEASDGYRARFTVEQFTGPLYRYPAIETGSEAGAVAVSPVASWAFRSGTTDIAQAREDDLRLVVGQHGLHSVNTAAMVKMMETITVSTDDAGQWPEPALSVQDGLLTIGHERMDQIKIHYTIDGTTPTRYSPVYNPSTSYFQPQLIQPVPVGRGATVRAFAAGFGRHDSDIVELRVE
jgi:hypothetical protein